MGFFLLLFDSVGFHVTIRPKFQLRSLVFSLIHSLNYIIMIVGRVRLKPQSLRFPRIRDQAVVVLTV